MPYIAPKNPKPIELDQWLGVNEAVGETEIKFGEATYSRNFRITKNYKPQKRNGHNTFIDFGDSLPVYGGYETTIGGKRIYLCIHNGNVYEYDLSVETLTTAIADLITEGTVTLIGTITNAQTSIFFFESKIYFINGTDYKEYDGTTYQDVVPYVPTIEIGGSPDGTGTENFEELNKLTGKRISRRIGDGSSNAYVLPAEPDSVEDVQVDGVSVAYTWVSGTTVTVTVAPANLSKVEIYYTIGSGDPTLVTKNRYATVFGKGSAYSVFLWGNPDRKNVYLFSGILKANYFPANTEDDVGTDETAITDMQSMQSQMLIFKESSTFSVTADENPAYALNNGLNLYDYVASPLNDKFGSLAYDSAQIIGYTPMTLDGGAFQKWSDLYSGIGVDPKNISDRIRLSLESIDLRNAITFNFKRLKEYWVNVDDIVYVYNYGTDVFYMFDNIEALRFTQWESDILFTSNGSVQRFNEDYKNDDTTAIVARLELAFTAFSMENWYKNIFYGWISIAAGSNTSCNTLYETDDDNINDTEQFPVSYKLFSYKDWNYANFSYATNRNPQTEAFKMKIKKFIYIRFVFENSELDQTLTILNFKVNAVATKEVR